MSPIKFPLEPQCLRIPTAWRRHTGTYHDPKGAHPEYFFVPNVEQHAGTELIEDPWKLRTEFLKMKHSEEAALDFLNKVGVWEAVEHEPQSNLGETTLAGTFGVTQFVGHARPITLEELWAEQEHWKGLLSPHGRAQLHAKFAPPKADAREYVRANFAFENTLQVHLEWKPGKASLPYAMVQTISGRELLVATVWIDLARRTKFKVCANDGIPFTGRKGKYCLDSCAHAAAVRAYRLREKKKKRARKSRA